MASLLARTLLPLTVLGLAAVTPACAAPAEEEEAGEGAVAFSEADAACESARSVDPARPTEAIAACLTQQANRLLEAKIAKAEDPRDKSLEMYRGKLRVPAETGCFTDDVNGKVPGYHQYDIDERRDVGELGVQIRALIEFLAAFHRDLDGYPNHFFKSVDICPEKQVGGELVLTGSTLRIGVTTGLFGRVGIHTGSELRNMWTDGEHLRGALEPLRGLRWALLDPVGSARVIMRGVLRDLIGVFKKRLEGVQGKPTEQMREELSRIVREETLEKVGESAGEAPTDLRQRVLAKIATMSAAQLAKLAKDWRLEVEKTELSSGVEDGATSMHDAAMHRDIEINAPQDAILVNMQNYKQISVDVQAFLPRSSFSRYVQVVKSTTKVNAPQGRALVNIQLNDVIDVKLHVVYSQAAQTASLERVLPR